MYVLIYNGHYSPSESFARLSTSKSSTPLFPRPYHNRKNASAVLFFVSLYKSPVRFHPTRKAERTLASLQLVCYNFIIASRTSNFLVRNNSTMPTKAKPTVNPAFDPEVLGGDTCALGECCVNPVGFFVSRISRALNQTFSPKNENATTAAEVSYVGGCYGGWAIVFYFIYPMISNSEDVSEFHKSIGYLLFLSCVSSWRLAKTTCPGTITADTLDMYDNYAYDNILYTSRICPTKQIRKLARSKYDRFSGNHVPRFDHHCPVLNRTVGERNYRFFLLFLVIHSFMCWYGSLIVFWLLWEDSLSGRGGKIELPRQLFSQLFVMLRWRMPYTVLAVSLGLSGAFLATFLSFHLYIISRGMTTNEYYKWKSIQVANFEKDEEVASSGTKRVSAMRRANNFYHIGILKNFYEVLHPRCQRRAQFQKRS